jgi:serine/threonine protein kinase
VILMPESLLTCPKGHTWDPAANGQLPEGAPLLHCPICGAEPETIVREPPELSTPSLLEQRTLSAGERGTASSAWPIVPGYEILGVLGRGGMGVVYKARHLSLNRLVALKMVLAGAHAAPGDLARFRTEAEAVASLQHPNIVQIYEIGEREGCPYLALEFVNGGSLAQALASQPLPPRDAAQLTETLARAVHAAHQRNIVHRDLKPANILLAFSREPPASAVPALAGGSWLNECVPKITDFGLAKRLDSVGGQTKTGAVMGTPCYMAPEQASGKTKQIGPATDTYALGAIFYELLTGQPPFLGETELDTLIKVGTEDPVFPRRLQRKVPRDLEIICLQCLQKEPDKRFPSAQALADELRRFLNDEPILTRPMGRLERARRWLKRRREVAMMLVGAMATICLLLLCAGLANLGKPPASEENEKAKKEQERLEPLPPDLALVPQDALAFMTLRVGDLWNATGIERARDRLFKDHPQLAAVIKQGLADMEAHAGFGLADIERVTFLIVRPEESGWALIVATKKPFDIDKVRRIVGTSFKSRRQNDLWYYVGNKRGPNAIYALSERIFVAGMATPDGPPMPRPPPHPGPQVNLPPARPSLEVILDWISKRNPQRERGPLRPALQRAAKKHDLVAGYNPPPEHLNLAGLFLGPEYQALRPLLALRSATLTLDLESSFRPQVNGDTLKTELHLGFADESRAAAARDAAEKGLAIARKQMQAALDQLALAIGFNKEFGELWKLASKLLNQLESAYRLAEVRVDGTDVVVGFKLVTDLPELATTIPTIAQEFLEVGQRNQAASKLRQLVIAMHSYHDTFRRLPPAVLYDKTGKPMHSWRVLLLPYLEQPTLFRQFKLNEPWDSPHNSKLLAMMPEVYAPMNLVKRGDKTCYQVFTGRTAPFAAAKPGPGQLRPFKIKGREVDLYETGPIVKLDSFTDGTANTILIVEARDWVPWTKPEDLHFRPEMPLPPLGGQFKTGFLAAMADASVKLVGRTVSEKSIRAAITPAGNDVPGPDWPR